VALALSQRQAGPPPPGTPGPWDNDVQVYRTDKDGRVDLLASFPRAGVPTIARLADGRLIAAHQYFPENDATAFDKVAVHFSGDEGQTWTNAAVIRLTGLPDGMRFPFDPTLVPLPDGRVRLYFTSTRAQGPGEDRPAIYSAISPNGLDFTVEPGRRFGIDGRPVIDSAVVLHRGTFHLFAPDNGTSLPGPGSPPPAAENFGIGYHATSTDGLTFRRDDDVKIEGRRRWLGGAVSDGASMTFFGTGDANTTGRLQMPIGAQAPAGAPRPTPQASRGGIWTATSRDGQSWRLGSAPPIPGADPGAVATRDGGWIVVVTGPPRSNTASATRGNANPPGAARASDSAAAVAPPDGGPRNHRLVLATSLDGLTWTLDNVVFAEHASVPALFEGPDNRLVALFVDASGDGLPGALGARVERGDGTWERRQTNLRGADPDVVRLADGSYRAYTKEPDGSIPVFWSRDGLAWSSLGTAFRDPQYANATDPDVFETPGGWVMLLSLGPQLLRATSTDGLVFTATGVANLGGSVSTTVKVPGGWRTYFHVNASPLTGGRMIIRSAFTTDGAAWRVDPGDRVVAPADGPARYGVADPAPVRRADGSWVMLVKSFIEPPR
jgi:hypothetical protein